MVNEKTKEKTEEKKSEDTVGNPNEGDNTQALNKFDRADATVKGLAEENTRMEKNIKRLEELRGEQILSGVTEAGQTPKPKEESNADYANKVLANDIE